MDPRIQRELTLARKVALAGAIIMTLFTIVTFLGTIVIYLAYRQVGITETYTGLWWLRSMLSEFLGFFSFCALTRFLLLFASISKPDLRELSAALIVSGVTMLARQICNYKLAPLNEMILIITEPIPIGIIPDYTASIRMFPISFFILLLCVVALLRYMDALREDSESIV
jgi:hypothetical protein